MERLFRRRLSKVTLLAFATSLSIVPAASAMPMPSDPAAASHPSYRVVQPVALDGWYTAVVKTAHDGVVKVAPAPAVSDGFAWRNAGIAFALSLVLTAVIASGIVRVRRERHVPILR